jgi:hypothetical protein
MAAPLRQPAALLARALLRSARQTVPRRRRPVPGTRRDRCLPARLRHPVRRPDPAWRARPERRPATRRRVRDQHPDRPRSPVATGHSRHRRIRRPSLATTSGAPDLRRDGAAFQPVPQPERLGKQARSRGRRRQLRGPDRRRPGVRRARLAGHPSTHPVDQPAAARSRRSLVVQDHRLRHRAARPLAEAAPGQRARRRPLPRRHPTPALARNGTPLHADGISITVPGLGYVGLEYQRNFSSATIRGVGRDARHVLGKLNGAARLDASPKPPARRLLNEPELPQTAG